MKIVIASAAEAELRETIIYYRSIFLELGAQFFQFCERSIDRIRQFPEACPAISGRARKCRIEGFPCAIIYRFQTGSIRIVAVSHLTCDRSCWRDRLS